MSGQRQAFLLVDHGSRRLEANALIDEVATAVRHRLGPGAIVEPAHMEIAKPTVADGFKRCVEQGATMVVVHPFMLAPGRHVREDLPRLATEAARAHRSVAFVMAAPLGKHEGIIAAVVDRCRAAVAERNEDER